MLNRILAIIFGIITLSSSATAGETLAAWKADPSRIFSTSDVDLEEMVWVARPLIVFADSPLDPTFRQQMALLLSLIHI